MLKDKKRKRVLVWVYLLSVVISVILCIVQDPAYIGYLFLICLILFFPGYWCMMNEDLSKHYEQYYKYATLNGIGVCVILHLTTA